jgi:hypothetical protein
MFFIVHDRMTISAQHDTFFYFCLDFFNGIITSNITGDLEGIRTLIPHRDRVVLCIKLRDQNLVESCSLPITRILDPVGYPKMSLADLAILVDPERFELSSARLKVSYSSGKLRVPNHWGDVRESNPLLLGHNQTGEHYPNVTPSI